MRYRAKLDITPDTIVLSTPIMNQYSYRYQWAHRKWWQWVYIVSTNEGPVREDTPIKTPEIEQWVKLIYTDDFEPKGELEVFRQEVKTRMERASGRQYYDKRTEL